MRRAVVRMIVGLVLTLPAPLLAQGGAIRGSVADSSGTPLPNASITVEGTNLRTTSGSQGDYELRGVPAGRQTVRARLIGYLAASAPVTVVAGDAARQDFRLGRSAVQLAPIDVVIGSRARHTASEELAVPVDVFPAEVLQQQGTMETSQILQAV
ncbi:MAG TPA: carboxypeptidase-like regulatory domain-containing protein, partial [Gemmatimonadales bacterium]|nr:carboxypeptidase-like regulatory domain-containing protein [Gemmatimonadales bacterium]